MWIVPTPFCALTHVNVSRNFSGDGVTKMGHVQRVQISNVELYQSKSPEHATDLHSHGILGITLLGHIRFAEKC